MGQRGGITLLDQRDQVIEQRGIRPIS